eukprot:CAMPEP_0183703720 /NCGR_PEP_ID=MMETSP0737-20130205/1361_1 /TAXON_ID=385413 /ORGANISM="Thalassiosira miniscula, Strain CCMP1093" /LENGTH=250 /DNA_ID=CAMNT_0025930517 /DNA_START=21 /DNA_END=773 /DNA_ORIENTATION=-
MGKFPLPLVLHAATVGNMAASAGASNSFAGPVAQRSLSQSLLRFFTIPQPKVDRCWWDMEVNDETGENTASIKCDFIVPKHYNSTADIHRGSCEYFIEPVCEEMVDGACVGSFVLSGEIRTTLYPDMHQKELNSDMFNQTYCARADVYQDITNTGKQLPIAHASRELTVTFTGGRDYLADITMEVDGDSESSTPRATIIGSVVGTVVLIPIIALYILMKRRKVEGDVHDSPDTEGDAHDAKIQEGDIELV